MRCMKEKRVKNNNLSKCLLILFSIFVSSLFAQKDSLLQVLHTAKDTTRIATLIRLAGVQLMAGERDEAEKSLKEAESTNRSIKDSVLYAKINLRFASLEYRKSEFKNAYTRCHDLLPFLLRLGDDAFINECKTNLGMCIGRMGDFRSALEYYHEVLPYYEKQKDSRPLIRLYSNIAGVYFDQLDYNMAIEYFNRSLKISLDLKDHKTIGQSYNNIGSALQNMGKHKEAKQYYLKAIPINKYSKNLHNLAYNYMNIASCEFNEGDLDLATEHNKESLKILRSLEDPYAIASCLNMEAELLMAQGKSKEALKVMEESVLLSEKTGSPLLMEKTYKQLADVYSKTGDHKNSNKYLYKFITTRDSIINENIREEVTKKKLAYEFEKQHLSDSLESAARQKILSDQIENSKKRASLQRNISIISVFSVFAVSVLAFFVYRGAKRNKNASIIIEQQKKVVELKNKEMTDSMHYAKKIQHNLMAQKELINSYFPNNFILFKPKDIVSGDFYWATIKNDQFFLAVCDSTGHGIPGAFMSLLNMGFLTEAIKEKNISEPNAILNYIRIKLMESFGKDGQKDGMDGIVLCFDKKKNTITYSAANNPPILVRNGRVGELPYDKMPVGRGEKTDSFTLHQLHLKAGDSLYIYTDGYADQFGGTKARLTDGTFGQGKKYMYKKLNQKLLELNSKNMEEQLTELNKEFDQWKGELEQVDDVCVVGIKFT